MASVRMSNELRANLLTRALENFNTAKPKPELLGSDKTILRDAALNCQTLQAIKVVQAQAEESPALKHLIQKSQRKSIGLRGGMFTDTRYNEIKFINGDDYRTRSSNTVFSFSLDASVVVTAFTDEINLIEPGYYNDNALLICTEDLQPDDLVKVNEIVTSQKAKVESHQTDKNEYQIKLKSLLESTNTVGQFLEAWPGGEYLLPPIIIQKLNTKITRQQAAKKVKEEINFDADACNNIALTAKLMGA